MAPLVMPVRIFALLALARFAAAAAPNIVFLLADDLGYNEVGFMNGTRGLITPHLDAMASEGIILRNYYVLPICSPTRSALMTGRYPLRLGTQSNVIFWDTPWGIPLENKFIGQYLKGAAGGAYSTAMFGKWHLGMHAPPYTPWKRGFDRYAGYLQGCGSGWTHISSCCSPSSKPTHDDGYVCPPSELGKKDFRGYDWFDAGVPDLSANGTRSAEIIRKRALAFLREQAGLRTGPGADRGEPSSPPRPFFLYVAFQNIHTPYDCPERFAAMFARSGRRFSPEEQAMFGYLAEMDDVVGDIYHALRDLALWGSTLVVFSSDNGAPPAAGVRDRNWPLRGHKAQIWEGGVKVPGFVSGGAVPEVRRGAVSEELYHVTDWLPTLAALADAPLDGALELDGMDIWASLVDPGTPSPRTEVIYNINPLCSGGQAAAPKAGIRRGDFKLLAYCYSVRGRAGGRRTGPHAPHKRKTSWEFKGDVALFNLRSDPSETTDVSAAHPEVVAALLARLASFADASMVEPQQWASPYQGLDYYCAKCPLRPAVASPFVPWTPWINVSRLGATVRPSGLTPLVYA